MSARSFIAELESRKLLSDRTMQKLRISLAEVRTPLSAEALAKFLVARKLISKEQANDVLSGLTRSGINLEEEDADTVVGNDSSQSSSVFASHITTHPRPPEPDPNDTAHEDEISLAPIAEDEEKAEEELVPSAELHEHDEIRLAPPGSHFGSANQKSIDEFESDEDLASLEEDPERRAGLDEEDLPSLSGTYSERLRTEESTEAGLLEEGFGTRGIATAPIGPDQPPPTDKQKAANCGSKKERKTQPSQEALGFAVSTLRRRHSGISVVGRRNHCVFAESRVGRSETHISTRGAKKRRLSASYRALPRLPSELLPPSRVQPRPYRAGDGPHPSGSGGQGIRSGTVDCRNGAQSHRGRTGL
jgi:hypothetical protein